MITFRIKRIFRIPCHQSKIKSEDNPTGIDTETDDQMRHLVEVAILLLQHGAQIKDEMATLDEGVWTRDFCMDGWTTMKFSRMLRGKVDLKLDEAAEKGEYGRFAQYQYWQRKVLKSMKECFDLRDLFM